MTNLLLQNAYVTLTAMEHKPIPTDQWVDIYADSLFSYCLKYIPQHDIAENLVQETFLAALKNHHSFKSQSSEKTWLIGILKHKITDYLRLKYRETPVSQLIDEQQAIDAFFDRESDHLRNEPSNWNFNPSETLASQEFWKTYHDCLSKLPEKTAQAFSLREMDALDSIEICKVLNITSTNLWVLLHRARIQLRQCLEMNWFKP